MADRKLQLPVRFSFDMTQEEFIEHALKNPSDVDALVKHLKIKMKRDARYDFNFSAVVGKGGESLVEQLLSGGYTVEVKRDFRVGDTGNVLIEYGTAWSGKPSGILTSEADWYAFVFSGKAYDDEVVVFIKRERLLKVMDAHGNAKHPASGARGNTLFVTVPKEHLLAKDI